MLGLTIQVLTLVVVKQEVKLSLFSVCFTRKMFATRE